VVVEELQPSALVSFDNWRVFFMPLELVWMNFTERYGKCCILLLLFCCKSPLCENTFFSHFLISSTTHLREREREREREKLFLHL
jgi:hypothetical protein